MMNLFTFLGTRMNSTFPNDSGTKPNMTVYCNLIGMALQKKMSWEMLANTLDCIIPSFEESKQVIKILLKELEILQLSLTEKENDEIGETTNAVGVTENSNDRGNEMNGSLLETRSIEDVKERSDENKYLEQNEQANSSDASEADKLLTETDEYNLENGIINRNTIGIDNEWYTFVTNDQTHEEETKTMVEARHFEAIETKQTEPLIATTKDVIVPPKARGALFECDVCRKSFNSKGCLNRHNRIHTGEANFECDTCKKRFL